MPLVIHPCRSLCDWRTTRGASDLLSCRGCGSQWRPTEPWTPRQADGSLPSAVRARLSAGRADAADTAGS